MVKVTDKDYYMDGYLQKNLDIYKEAQKKDHDCFIVVDGAEGSGKSVLAQQIAYYLDPTFTIEQIAFKPNQFKNKVLSADKFKAIIFDEAMSGLNSRRAMWFVNIALVDMIAEIRQKNLYVIVVMPTFFDLDKYVAIWRGKCLIHVYYGDKKMERGYFRFYNGEKKKGLYILGKKFYNYGRPTANFYGRFTNFYTVDEQVYRQTKLDNLRVIVKEDSVMKAIEQRNLLVKWLAEGYNASKQEIADRLGFSLRQIYEILHKN